MTTDFNIMVVNDRNGIVGYSPASADELELKEIQGHLMFSFTDEATGRPVIINMSQEVLAKLTEKIL
jgi:hypothetical protein